MRLIYTGEPAPEKFSKSIFLAGPTPRSRDVQSWRTEALRLLLKKGYDGAVFVPENRFPDDKVDYDDQIDWEHRYLNMSDCVLFWIPRDLQTLPAFTTNVEFGWWVNSGKTVLGSPKDAPKMEYLNRFAEQEFVPQADTLEATIDLALKFVGNGADRESGERYIPVYVWRTPWFQKWYQTQKMAGNRLESAKVDWVKRIGKQKERIYLWALHPNVFIGSENRHKTNESVLGRPDVSTIVVYKRGPTILTSKVALVREFRSSAVTEDGFIWENPSGSSPNLFLDPKEAAVEELGEETGLKISIDRLVEHGGRQLAGTLSVHRSHLFSLEVTDEELLWLESQKGIPHGADLDIPTGERTYIEIMTVREMLSRNLTDWSHIGMILSVLQKTGN
ncbi:MAG: nucleoside 2-deoxyribosyltransferase domain-containing protein [Patescibacteria group bacterium]